MTGKDAYRIWAPAGARWVDWVRPVPFAMMGGTHLPGAPLQYATPDILYVAGMNENTAILIDLPAQESVKEGLALAKMGYRPIPLYNGTNPQPGAMGVVDNYGMESALLWGAAELAKIPISRNAPPAFLLDSNRMHRHRMNPSVFDNSWDLYHQDMPSAAYFLNHGVRKIVVRGEALQKDIGRIFYRFQQKGIPILFTDGFASPKVITLKKPPRKQE